MLHYHIFFLDDSVLTQEVKSNIPPVIGQKMELPDNTQVIIKNVSIGNISGDSINTYVTFLRINK